MFVQSVRSSISIPKLNKLNELNELNVAVKTPARMSTSSVPPIHAIPVADLQSFSSHLKSSTRIVALLGAGLSASSGLPTFRGAGGIWRSHDAMSLATPDAFDENPGLVWQFYSYRRHMALQAQPNRAHFALAELARRKPGFITLSQNVDGILDSSSPMTI